MQVLSDVLIRHFKVWDFGFGLHLLQHCFDILIRQELSVEFKHLFGNLLQVIKPARVIENQKVWDQSCGI